MASSSFFIRTHLLLGHSSALRVHAATIATFIVIAGEQLATRSTASSLVSLNLLRLLEAALGYARFMRHGLDD